MRPKWLMRSGLFFFFQAEDGIRDYKVTGVQTCALPILAVVTQCDRPLAFGRPHPAQDRLQPDAVLVRGPDFDRRVRALGSRLSDGLLEQIGRASCRERV